MNPTRAELISACDNQRNINRCLRQVNAALLAALEAVEWGRTTADWDSVHGDQCPACGHFKGGGHAPDCKLAAALALARE